MERLAHHDDGPLAAGADEDDVAGVRYVAVHRVIRAPVAAIAAATSRAASSFPSAVKRCTSASPRASWANATPPPPPGNQRGASRCAIPPREAPPARARASRARRGRSPQSGLRPELAARHGPPPGVRPPARPPPSGVSRPGQLVYHGGPFPPSTTHPETDHDHRREDWRHLDVAVRRGAAEHHAARPEAASTGASTSSPPTPA